MKKFLGLTSILFLLLTPFSLAQADIAESSLKYDTDAQDLSSIKADIAIPTKAHIPTVHPCNTSVDCGTPTLPPNEPPVKKKGRSGPQIDCTYTIEYTSTYPIVTKACEVRQPPVCTNLVCMSKR